MTKFNEELAKAGVLIALDGLSPPSQATAAQSDLVREVVEKNQRH